MSTAAPVVAVTFGELVEARAEDDSVALHFEERSWTWREVVAESRLRAGLAASLVPASGRGGEPWHVGLFLENTPEHLFWWLGAALSGMTVVGLNPTRRGGELARDVTFTECRLLVVDEARAPLLEGVSLGAALDADPGGERVLRVGSASYDEALAGAAPYASREVSPDTVLSLIFTSGTTSAPKAVVCTQGRMGRIAQQQVERRELTGDDVFYVVMPMFHSNAIMAGVAPAVCTGGTLVLRRRFSASGFLPDVRRHGVTFFNYVGKPLHYVLAQPERPDDADNTLRICFGNEAGERDIAEFSRRFDCRVIDSFGSSEGEIVIQRLPGTPSGSLGRAPEGTIVVDPTTGVECPPARFDASGRLLNGEEATGEIVNTVGVPLFEGYWKNPEAEASRTRGGWIWSGDLAYRDAEGWFYFAGRNGDWLRVDGENIAAAPIERLLGRFPGFAAVAVLAVPDESVGDQVLAVVEMTPGAVFDPEAFGEFLAAQPDLGTKWAPRYVRVVDEMPRTASNKLLKRAVSTTTTGERVYERTGPHTYH